MNKIDLYTRLRDGLYQDDAIVGEAAGYAIGLIMLGSNNAQAIEDLVTYSHETQHEKIIRAISIALSLIVYGIEEGANTLIEQLSREKDPILRYGAMYTIGMAYAGSGNNEAFKKLIKFSVSDNNDDVRRAALINIGFLHIKNPELLLENIKVLSLLSESYNPHVRYGTVNSNAFNILQPLFNDNHYYVRQGALISAGLIFSHVNPSLEPKITQLREEIEKAINDKEEHPLVRFGGLLASGFLELGGRNAVISLVSK
jgi:26S proteasome regulatory subunit N2